MSWALSLQVQDRTRTLAIERHLLMAANNGDKDAKEFITSRLTQNQLQQLGFSDNSLSSLPGECGGKWGVPPPPPECWGYSHGLAMPIYAALETEPRALCILG